MYELIQHQKLDSAASSITFSNIPQTYTDLVVQLSGRTTKASFDDDINIAFNSSSTATVRDLVGKGSSVSSINRGNILGYINAASTTSNTFSPVTCYIPNYSGSLNKSFSTEMVLETNDSSNNLLITYTGQWPSTAPITSIVLTSASASNFVVGSSATLYGINRTAAFGKPKAIGGNITFANGHWVHTFTGSGMFYAQEDLQVDALVVAGGGGASSGGGGAGGFLRGSSTLVRGSYPVIIGSGGTSSIQGTGLGATKGQDSIFANLTALGGGASNLNFSAALQNGGSGSGGHWNTSGGSGTPGQGNNGGSGSGQGFPNDAQGGGGGAGAAGSNAGAGVGGAGGAGAVWFSTHYAGGGGGAGRNVQGAGGIGGGGNGDANIGFNATANTGGGAGGGMSYGGNGGSGVVIIRYPA